MDKKTKEEKILEHGAKVIEDFQTLYDTEARAVIEYEKLLHEYQRLNKRFNKIIRINDAVSKDVIVNNEDLKDSVDYTIKAAREKLLQNVSEHRKTKEKLAQSMLNDKEKGKTLENQLELAQIKISKLERELELSKSSTSSSSVQNAFQKRADEDPTLEINLPKFKSFSFEEILDKEIKKADNNKTALVIAKLTIDNFSDIKLEIEKHGNISTFLRGTVKYLYVTLGNDNIVYFSHHNIFYLMFPGINIERAKTKIDIANIKRKLGSTSITFSIGATEYDFYNDDLNSITQKCNLANEEASLSNNESSFSVKLKS